MELDQLLFKRVLNYFKKRARESDPNKAFEVTLESLHPRLSILGRALSGASIQVVSSEREGGWKDNTFFLPKEISLHEDVDLNVDHYLFRIFYLAKQRELGLNWKSGDTEKDQHESQKAALNSSERVLREVFSEFPLLKDVYHRLRAGLQRQQSEDTFDTSWLYGRWMKNSGRFEEELLAHTDQKTFQADQTNPETELKAQHADEVEVLTVDRKAQEDYVLTHNFEKVETAEEFTGVWRDFDGDDSLKEDADALNDVNVSQLVRVDDPVHSIYQAELADNVNIAESKEVNYEGRYFSYPEWIQSERTYKMDFCKVFPEFHDVENRDYYLKTIHHNRRVLHQLQKTFARLNNDREQVKRQLTGENIDLDAVVDLYADLKAQHTPDERLFLSSRKRRKELSMLFLLDLSLSSDGYAKGNRIIDVEKQVSILFGEVLSDYDVDFQIDGFYSKTRNYTKYIHLKSFDQPWQNSKWNIGSVQPQGYTRIGPAMRHATALLKRRKTRKKWLIFISDGKPNDYDRYEGKHGIQDVKQALREMGREGISNYAIAIEEQAKYYLPQMFGDNHYNILSGPIEMIDSLTKLYRRIQQD